MEDRRAPHLIRNWISSAGHVIAGVLTFVIIYFLVLSFVYLHRDRDQSPAAGLLTAPAGMFLDWRNRQRTGTVSYRRWPSVDLEYTACQASTPGAPWCAKSKLSGLYQFQS
jgi:hypothetical protein